MMMMMVLMVLMLVAKLRVITIIYAINWQYIMEVDERDSFSHPNGATTVDVHEDRAIQGQRDTLSHGRCTDHRGPRDVTDDFDRIIISSCHVHRPPPSFPHFVDVSPTFALDICWRAISRKFCVTLLALASCVYKLLSFFLSFSAGCCGHGRQWVWPIIERGVRTPRGTAG